MLCLSVMPEAPAAAPASARRYPGQLSDARRARRRAWLVLLSAGWLGWSIPSSCPADEVAPPAAAELATHAAALLESRCQACHGVDQHEGGLRLDQLPAILAGGDSGPAVVAGRLAESLLWERVTADDESIRMPQDADPLTEDERQVLRSWIEAGAPWPEQAAADGAERHWSFRPVVRPPVPSPTWPDQAVNAIDAFLQVRLAEAGLKPAPAADRYTLIRRLSLDLVGLPPTPAEADAFIADPAPDAYERLVERLLASPHYGERWARRWLDLARYADTNGYEKDRTRSIWPYRDWVIQALNADLPFDQFTVEQLAGDLLPGAGLSQRIATGFHRNTMLNEEGGVDVEEFRHAAIVDRVSTTATVWLGLTLGCAQCHSHKYDPLSHREYYQFFAFFNNVDEPELDLPEPAVVAARDQALAELARLEAELESQFPLPPELAAAPDPAAARREYLDQRQAIWEAELRPRCHAWQVVRPTTLSSHKRATLSLEPDGSVLATGDKPNNDTYVLEFDSPLATITAVRLEALPHAGLPDGGPGRAPLFEVGNFFLNDFRVEVAPVSSAEATADGAVAASGVADSAPTSGPAPVTRGETAWQRLPLAEATHSFAQQGREAALAIDDRFDSGWSVMGRIGRENHAVVRLAEPLPAAGRRLRITLDQQSIHQTTLGRFRLSVTDAGGAVVSSGQPAAVEAALLMPVESRGEAERAALRGYFLRTVPDLAPQQARIDALRRQVPRLPTTLVMEERAAAQARVTHRHHRGEFLQPREEVPPGVPAVLPPLAAASADRLALARWLVSTEQPLTSRVTVNRHWEAFFGRGLVATPDDLGAKGSRPSHPELLDWLAAEFLAQGWSQKALHRLIVTSHAYRQSVAVAPEVLARDPDNLLLARAPRLRLDAELVRDRALAASGLLNPAIGGPSVYPPQPAGVSELAYGDVPWPTDTGPNRYRRGLYTFAKRTSPYALFNMFDGPTGETCLARRERSNTPLQALSAMNDTVFVEAAQALGRWASSPGAAESTTSVATTTAAPAAPEGDDAARLAALFRRCLTRPPDPEEAVALQAFYEGQRQRLLAGELASVAVAGLNEVEAGLLPRDQQARRAAFALVARALVNLDEFLVKD